MELLEKERIFKASFHSLFNVLVVVEFVVSALSASVWLSSWNKVLYWLLQSAHPQEYIDNPPTCLFRRKNYEGNTALKILFSLSQMVRERNRWRQSSKFPCFSQQGGLHVVRHSKKHDFHRASGSSQNSQQGINLWPLLRLQNCT